MTTMKHLLTFQACIKDLLSNDDVISMKDIKQHVNISCLEHSLFVSYTSYRICLFLGWDFTAAARGGLLHDLFLYNQHQKNNYTGTHLSFHPKAALKNASRICELTDLEKDIILKHMWPLTLRVPKYKESFVVNITDTICAFVEMLFVYKQTNLKKKLWSVLACA